MNVKNLLLPALALFLFSACEKTESTKPEPASVKKINQFENKTKIDRSNVLETIDLSELTCDSGTFNIIESKPPEYHFEKCKKDGLFIHGLFVAFDGYAVPYGDLNVSFVEDLNLTDDEEKVTVSKGSYLRYAFDNAIQDASLGILTMDMKFSLNDKRLNINDLKIQLSSSSCGFVPIGADCMEQLSIDVLAGSLDVDKMHFTLDEAYASNRITLTENGLRDDTAIHLLDSEGHKVELAVEGDGISMKENYLVLKIDENGDGVFTDKETRKLKD